NLMIEAPSRQNHNSIVSDIESTTTSPTQQLQQTIVLINESNKCTQKLVMFKDLSTT
ncbi:unnamed protein product, partial [Rotaria magnacalcarata]